MVYNATLNDYVRAYNSCTMYIVFLIITFTILMGIGSICL